MNAIDKYRDEWKLMSHEQYALMARIATSPLDRGELSVEDMLEAKVLLADGRLDLDGETLLVNYCGACQMVRYEEYEWAGFVIKERSGLFLSDESYSRDIRYATVFRTWQDVLERLSSRVVTPFDFGYGSEPPFTIIGVFTYPGRFPAEVPSDYWDTWRRQLEGRYPQITPE